jgi:hypothetical protein
MQWGGLHSAPKDNDLGLCHVHSQVLFLAKSAELIKLLLESPQRLGH